MTLKQKEFLKKHGTLEQFEKALLKAAMDFAITPKEGNEALDAYKREWEKAGKDQE